MSNKIEGVVFKVYPKTFPGKPETYSIKIDGDPIYYRSGTNRFAGIAESGNRVTFMATPNADGKSARIDSPVTLVAAPPPAAASGTPALGGDRQNNIVYQSSRKDAIELVKLILSTEAMTLPTKKADRLAALEALVDHYTAQFFEDVSTLGAVTRENESEGVPAAKADGGGEDDGE